MTRIIIVDDHTLVRHLLRDVLSAHDDIEVVADLASGEDLLCQIDELAGDAIVLDIGLGGEDGIEITKKLRRKGNKTPVMFLTMHLNHALLKRGFDAGALGYAVKHDAVEILIEGIREVAAGNMFISPALAANPATPESEMLDKLSKRELEVASLVASSWKATEIADHLQISERTVHFHRRSIADKTGLKRIADITKFAISIGLRADE